MRRFVPLLCIALAAPRPANSGVPYAGTSTTPACLVVCPQGEIAWTVIVRDVANNPVRNTTVVVDLSQCPGVRLCPPDGTEPYEILPGPKLQMVTGSDGKVVFPIRAGGVCQGTPLITALGFDLHRFPYVGVASPDQDGSLIVDDRDEAILVEKILRDTFRHSDVTAGVNCSGGGDALSALLSHLGHACRGVVPVSRRSWGRLKVLYR